MFSSGSRIKTKHCTTDQNEKKIKNRVRDVITANTLRTYLVWMRCTLSEYRLLLHVGLAFVSFVVRAHTIYQICFLFFVRFVLFRTENIKYRSSIVDHLHHSANQSCACISAKSVDICRFLRTLWLLFFTTMWLLRFVYTCNSNVFLF